MSLISEGTILIARRELSAELQDRLSDPAIRVFSAADAHAALSTVVKHHVPVVVLDRRFATSPGGNEFLAELRTTCGAVEVRILDDQNGELPQVLRKPLGENARAAIARHSHVLRGPIRRAPRYPVDPGFELLVNGEATPLVNVSATGAQLVSAAAFRPAQQVRVTVAEGERLLAAVAWSAFELSELTGKACYRVGLEFADAKPEIVRAYCREHGIEVG
jgi:hypothetical protein